MGLQSIGLDSAEDTTGSWGRGAQSLKLTILPLTVVMLFALGTASAQSILPARFTRISVEQGLSQSTVQAILQDHRGFLWFGTEEGLNRYDGYSFVIFRNDPQDPQSLLDNKISALHEDRRGRLWVGSWKGLSLFDYRTEKFSAIPEIRQRVTAVVEDPDGTMWVGTEGDGLFVRDPSASVFRQYEHFSTDPNSLGTYIVSSLLRDRKGRLWIGTFDAGADRFDETTKRFIHYRADPRDAHSLSHNEVWGLAEDGEGKIWIATYGGGLNVFDEKTGGFQHYHHSQSDPNSLRTDRLTCVFVDRSGKLWIGTDGAGLEQYDPSSGRFVALVNDPADLSSLSNNVVRTINEDVQGHIWVGTYLGGADLLKNARRGFVYFTHQGLDRNSLSAPNVASFLEDSAGRIWIGTEGGWLNRFDPQSGTFLSYRFPSSIAGGAALLCLHQDKRGRIWVGTYRGGLARFNPATGSFTAYRRRHGDSNTVASDEIWAMEEDAEGKLWLGTNGGLDRFDPDLGIVLSHYDASLLERPGVRALHFDKDGNLWVGVLGTLDLLPKGSQRFVHYGHDDHDPSTLSHPSVSAVLEDHKGRIWIGTLGGGVNLFDAKTGKFTQYTDFPSRDINGMQEDAAGQLWLATDHGLSRFDPDTGSIQNFDLTSGLQSLQFHLGASLKRRSGRLLFGSTDGFYDFDPKEIVLDTYAPPVVFTALRIFNEPARLPAAVSALNRISLSPQDKIFSVEFSALDYTFPRHNRYAYKLEGFSDKWIGLDNKREVTFTNLDPGEYVFRVKASNSDGVWGNGSIAALRVVVQPPFWKTWWFRGFSVLLIGLVVLTAHRVRVAGLTRDIERRKQVVYALRASEERFSKAFHANPAPMSITRLNDGVLIDINQSNLNLLDYERDEVIGRSAMDLGILGFGQDDDVYRALLQQGSTRDRELQVRTKSGKVRPILSSAEIIELGGERCVLTAALNLTEHKRLEGQLQQSQRMEAIGKLAGGVAHDFNNLLTVIKGYCGFLAKLPHAAEGQTPLRHIEEAADRATALTRQLLAFSRRQVLQPKTFNLNELLQNLMTMLRPLIGEDVEIVTVLDPNLGTVKADPNQIEQVIMNLALNAREAMPKGGKLTLETANHKLDSAYANSHIDVQAGRYVLLAVSDNGCGMDPETMTHVFEPFFTTKELGKGTGLGLSTVYGSVQQSGGHVTVYSEPGHGSTFKVYLPRVDEPVGGATEESSPAVVVRGHETVLLVEDDPQVRELAHAVLTSAGYSVLVGDNARTALSLCETYLGRIDLLLTDVVMPGLNGHELALRVAHLRPGTKVIYMSGYTDNALFQHGVTDGALFLQKPFTPASLTAAIQKVLDQAPVAPERSKL